MYVVCVRPVKTSKIYCVCYLEFLIKPLTFILQISVSCTWEDDKEKTEVWSDSNPKYATKKLLLDFVSLMWYSCSTHCDKVAFLRLFARVINYMLWDLELGFFPSFQWILLWTIWTTYTCFKKRCRRKRRMAVVEWKLHDRKELWFPYLVCKNNEFFVWR